MNSDTKQTDPTSSSNAGKNQIDNHKELLDMGFRLGAQGMEFLSVVAGVTAKDKRLKDVKNQAAALKEKDLGPKYSSKYEKGCLFYNFSFVCKKTFFYNDHSTASRTSQR